MIEPGAAARPSCVIGASVWVSVLDKLASPNWAVPTSVRPTNKQNMVSDWA